ncbi:hypothetical protein SCOR_03250 [Sulfidibacter corallicola]|uniref:Uncharacterized protein n=1 Tax=Sulfidibacter corallicola TaxID=2818388 RepID=A0A8A4TFP2_SULCO|nr:hypothetical protein [Sulfidibacter corallicola]QTD48453.1 hypothetical protein J3U87_22975 [Sulfidibacter corallicola]
MTFFQRLYKGEVRILLFRLAYTAAVGLLMWICGSVIFGVVAGAWAALVLVVAGTCHAFWIFVRARRELEPYFLLGRVMRGEADLEERKRLLRHLLEEIKEYEGEDS